MLSKIPDQYRTHFLPRGKPETTPDVAWLVNIFMRVSEIMYF